jgi:ABC-type transporter Mla maintaining outer membrane lipid asymmetry ATPase subunit MlaF
MAALLEFSAVNCGRISQLSFALEAGAAAVAHVGGREEKALAIDLMVGERSPDAGQITLDGVALDAVAPGSIGWVPEGGGLISNLKTWENVTLPLWYHRDRRIGETEREIAGWLAALGVSGDAMGEFMGSPAARLTPLERKRAGLLRGLLQAPRLLVVDAGLFRGVPEDVRVAWTAALEAACSGNAGSGVLVAAAESDPPLPWESITTR